MTGTGIFKDASHTPGPHRATALDRGRSQKAGMRLSSLRGSPERAAVVDDVDRSLEVRVQPSTKTETRSDVEGEGHGSVLQVCSTRYVSDVAWCQRQGD